MVKYADACFLFLLFSFGEAIAQTYTAPADSIESLHELYDPSRISNEIFIRTSEDAFGDQLQFISDDIERMTSHPLLLRNPTWHDLQQIPALTDLDIRRILRNVRDSTSLSNDVLGSTRMFIKRTPSIMQDHFSLRTRVVLDPDASKASVYQNGSYRGSPVKTVSRFRAESDDILFALVEAKDPGEPMYFDHLTGCFAIAHPFTMTDNISLSKFAVGDYSLSYGNGLLFANGYGQLSGRRVMLNAAPRSSGIQPFISSSSYRYFRGAAVELTSGIFSLSGFFSERKLDASLDSSGKTIVSFPSFGYHRTALELSRKDAAQANVAGAHLAITPLRDTNFLEIGATAYSLNYDKPVALKDSLSRGFSGQKHSMISAEMRSAFSGISWSTEFARMISEAGNANAFVMTLLGSPLKWLELSLNYRSLPENFISPFGSTFGINSTNAQNETGWYLGSKVTAIRNRVWFFGSANISRSLTPLRSTVHYSDILLGSEYSMQSVPVFFAFQFRSYGKGKVFSVTGDSLSKNSFRLDGSFDITKTIRLSMRAEFQRSYSIADSSSETGHLIGIKLYYLPLAELSIESGIAFFETDSYASRLYSDETDLPGSAPFVALYGNGYRYYLQLSYDIGKALTLSARIAETRYAPAVGALQLRKTTVGVQADAAF